ncbi:MAG TPA: PilT/PilU family type 4a pilus ATPase, partial [Acidimicrobiales bacterium]|nr:PilT/PilU family type 4a pilus ATPase [Acidimicrobiales bacterium]
MAVEPRLDTWLGILHEHNGTDILLTEGSSPLLRVDGQLMPLEGVDPLSSDDIQAISRKQLDDAKGERVHPRSEVDFSFSWNDKARIRANAFYQRGACSLSLRRIPMDIPSPEELGLPQAMSGILRNPSGLILVTGPTGSGKSTSMASMIDVLNKNRRCHIITIEDPIEYLHENHKAAVSQREVGTDTESFENALKAVLREDPDVVLVGEMRDLESISAALTIAETGHLVITTLHTNDSAQSIDRIIDVFPGERRNQIMVQLAGTLLGVLYQRLLPKRGGGMVAAYELMVGVPAVRNLVREGKTRQLRNVVATHRQDGMQTLEHALNDLVRRDVVDYEVALEASLYPQEIDKPQPVV